VWIATLADRAGIHPPGAFEPVILGAIVATSAGASLGTILFVVSLSITVALARRLIQAGPLRL
jgi:hypothetical protein